jgi:hypothetical protein
VAVRGLGEEVTICPHHGAFPHVGGHLCRGSQARVGTTMPSALPARRHRFPIGP